MAMVFTTLAVMEREDVKREIAKQRVFNALLDLIVSAKWNSILSTAILKAIEHAFKNLDAVLLRAVIFGLEIHVS